MRFKQQGQRTSRINGWSRNVNATKGRDASRAVKAGCACMQSREALPCVALGESFMIGSPADVSRYACIHIHVHNLEHHLCKYSLNLLMRLDSICKLQATSWLVRENFVMWYKNPCRPDRSLFRSGNSGWSLTKGG